MGETDAGETIYQARSVRLVLRDDAAHFNRLVICSKCGREVPGRAVLGPAELDQPARGIVCSDCVEAATAMAAKPDPPAVAGHEGMPVAPVAVDEPALADAAAQMNGQLEGRGEETEGSVDEEVGARDVLEPDDARVELDEINPVEDEAAAPASELADQEIPLDEDEPSAPLLEPVAGEAPGPEDESPADPGYPSDEEWFNLAGSPAPASEHALLYEYEFPAPADREPLAADAGAGAGQPDPLRLTALEETVQRLAEQVEAQTSIREALEFRVEELGAALAAASVDKEGDRHGRRMDDLAKRLKQLQGTIDTERARAKSETATTGQAIDELSQRVSDLAEQATNTSAQPSPESDPSRLDALERQVQHGQAEVSELHELHAALDAGLGVLRSELAEVRATLTRAADSQADLEDRLETFVRMSLVPEGTQGRKAKKAAESTMGTLSAAVQDLLREQRQLKDAVAALEQASDAAMAAATRASMNASSLGPLRSDIKLLHQEVLEHNQELEALRRTVARLRQPEAPTPAKAATAKAPAKRDAAKAAIAKAAAAQAAAAKKAPPAAQRPSRARKA